MPGPGRHVSAFRARSAGIDGAGVYLTDGVFLNRVAGFVTGAGDRA